MKRKFRLFATVASLCLSVALMAFGVYAATEVTYTVTGSVTFTNVEVASTWTTGAYKADGTTLWDDKTSEGGSTYYKTFATTAASDTNKNASFAIPTVAFSTTQNKVIYKIKVANDGSQAFYVHIEDAANKLVDVADQLSVSVRAGKTGALAEVTNDIAGLTTANVDAGTSYEWEITVTLDDFTKTLPETALSLVFTANYTA